MRRFTTPTHKFVCEVDPREWDEYRITYCQLGAQILEKTEQDAPTIEVVENSGTDCNGNPLPTLYIMNFRLTQYETSLFKPNTKVEIQIRAHYPEGTVVASDIMTVAVQDVLNTEILGDED